MEPKPTSVLVHLSGSRRGASHRLSANQIRLGTGHGMDIRLPLETEPIPSPHHATLRCRGLTYEVEAEGDSEVWVNGERASRFTLASGDVLEIGRDGAVLRYRIYDAGVAPYKSMAQVFGDCLDCARQSGRGPVGRAAMVLTDVPKQLATQTTPTFRAGVMTILILLAFVSVAQARRSARLERQLVQEATRVEGLAALLERTEEPSRPPKTSATSSPSSSRASRPRASGWTRSRNGPEPWPGSSETPPGRPSSSRAATGSSSPRTAVPCA